MALASAFGHYQMTLGQNNLLKYLKQTTDTMNQWFRECIGISVEPCRRDTFPAIALDTAYLAVVMKVDLDEPVVVCPVDPFVDDDYFEALRDLSNQADKGDANLVLLGMEPTYPSEKYGYIIPENAERLSKVKEFKGNPTEDKAKEFISQGALWNGGVFAYKLKYVFDKAHELIDFTD